MIVIGKNRPFGQSSRSIEPTKQVGIWILDAGTFPLEDRQLCGVFSTQERARKYATELNLPNWDVELFPLDPDFKPWKKDIGKQIICG